VARTASDVAGRASGQMREVELTMQRIGDSSGRVGDILGKIEGFAFQTNILALNAAAARRAILPRIAVPHSLTRTMETDCPTANIRRYGNSLEMREAFPGPSVHYEKNGVILLERSDIEFDHAFIGALSFPQGWKKIGTVNGITDPPIVFHKGKFDRTQSPLCSLCPDDWMLLKVYSELLRLELGFKLLVTQIFPSYSTVEWSNCTFRFVKTENEAPHLDSFSGGEPFDEKDKLPRLKFFLNVDSKSRVWNVGPALPDILKASRGSLGRRLPSDLNVLCTLINSSGILSTMPMVRVEIPPGGIVFANGATVLHQIVYGHRMVCVEGFVPKSSLQPSSICEWDNVQQWIAEAGYTVAGETEGGTPSGVELDQHRKDEQAQGA
jgi:Methyl-accepting chemotaxis protein (MCP) signalling domain